MASSTNLIQAFPRRQKHRNSAVTIALGRRWTHRKHSRYGDGDDGNCSSPVNSWEGFRKSEDSARKLAAGLWKMQFMQLPRDHAAASIYTTKDTCNLNPADGNVKVRFSDYDKSGENFKETHDQQRRPITILRSRNGLRREAKCSQEVYPY
ncbi:unnamed protein product [Sphenostylis stenocarpa]|uniref:Uncharacterized protein n=1 Tax=Sphenostylis stenocarpa TaxID=92480 RepID=A0AA86VZA4_9FABA|nr:unnamed protein product [Sphenostylis stenocarpa]